MSISIISHPQRRSLFLISEKVVLACYDLFRAAPLFTSEDMTECFGLQLQSGVTFFTRWYSITKRGNYYKVIQYRRQVRETNAGNRFWKPTHWFTPGLPGDKQHTPRNSWKVKILLESKEKRNRTAHRRICVTCQLEKKLFRGVSWPENYFSWILTKSVGYYPLRRVITLILQRI